MTTYCKNHPQTETTLRCNRCEEAMCVKCAVHTPTGYRCKDCINTQKKTFETARWRDYFLGFIAAAILSGIGSVIVGYISNFFYGIGVLFFAPFAATVIVNGARKATSRRRSQKLFIMITIGVIVGGLPAISEGIRTLIFVFANSKYINGINLFWWLLPSIWQGVYLFIAVPTVYTRFKGIQIR